MGSRLLKIGKYDVNFIYAKVEVTVKNRKIVSINLLEHRHERGKTAQTVINKIIDEQKIDFDAVSGVIKYKRLLIQNKYKRATA